MLFLIVLHSPHSAGVLFFPITAMLKKKSIQLFKPYPNEQVPEINLALQLTHPARKRTPTAELHYTDPQVPKAKPELLLAMNSKAIPNSNETEELLWRKQ